MIYENELKKLGLTGDQAKIYETLLKSPAMPARLIAKNARVGRELAYVVLGQLSSIGLAEKIESGGRIALFRALHPREIKKLVSQREKDANQAKETYENIFQSMTSDFNTAHHRPNVRFYEGVEGLKETYKEILDEAKEVFVLRSLHDHQDKEVAELVAGQIKKQAEAGINSYVLSPALPHMQKAAYMMNLERKITRKILPKEKFTLPAQVIIFGNKVSITSFQKEMITTIVENSAIAQTFRVIFNNLWDSVA
ncbi:MAG: hypothetical protein US50_C0004G0015 [Candidatus Nomurabacteria bacterium GW2011_GWB1_37_5]|uniref:Transcription regulator TrmB N-terminal domain-containing protein n=1 Tax=Candidatus Nomurabacteria bacterium GW2011_GWB1_37_5 TaxID=1618742 RepID=A0A0G0K5B1_9BACT|nr:MAG: hypothetical protein US50_C0004G0015 [Candidatus Nomurabacteria bacterium GW2011_GWB1_37_5]